MRYNNPTTRHGIKGVPFPSLPEPVRAKRQGDLPEQGSWSHCLLCPAKVSIAPLLDRGGGPGSLTCTPMEGSSLHPAAPPSLHGITVSHPFGIFQNLFQKQPSGPGLNKTVLHNSAENEALGIQQHVDSWFCLRVLLYVFVGEEPVSYHFHMNQMM